MPSIIFLGAPGAGKGTQRKLVVEKYGFAEIVLGDIMRNEVKNMTRDGIELKGYIDKGLLAPHSLSMKIVTNFIDNYFINNVDNIIFDGFPREIEQLNALDLILEKYKKYAITKVFFIKVCDDVVKKRIKNRSLTSGRVDDSNDKIINTRISVYHEITNSVVRKYMERGLVEEIDGDRPINDVFESIDAVLMKIFNKKNEFIEKFH